MSTRGSAPSLHWPGLPRAPAPQQNQAGSAPRHSPAFSPPLLCVCRSTRAPELAVRLASGDTPGSSWHCLCQSQTSAKRRRRTGSWLRQKNPSLCFTLVASRMNLAQSQHLFKHLVLLRTFTNPWGFVPRKCPALYSCSLLSLMFKHTRPKQI